MQFHLNGFQPGDPENHVSGRSPGPETLSGDADVVIVGCGPAGLTLAAQLSAFPGINCRIAEQKPGPLKLGQADGIACRTVEMFNAFGFAERLLREACWVTETTFWKPDEKNPDNIIRSGWIQDVEDGLSEFPHVILNQARVHDFYLETMRKGPAGIEPVYSRKLVDLEIDVAKSNDPAAHPVTLTFERTDEGHEGEKETIRARYVVGCDGARSTVRRSLGWALHGDSANQAWGVMDILAVTDFPDIRNKSVIQSYGEGSVIIIPREGGYLFRVYVELDELKKDERVANRNVTVDHVIAAARRVLHPHTLDVKEVAWWSVYEIGQRLCDRFDDVPAADVATRLPRVFIAGDACHTHSPKAGQGMNVSMQDTFNLGWKLQHVLEGKSAPDLLKTYSAERQAVAGELIRFDREWAAMLSAPLRAPGAKDGEGVDPAEVQQYFVQHGRYTAGTATQYTPSVISGVPAHQGLAKGYLIGTRFHSAPVVRLSDAKPVQLGHIVTADGRWRLFAFAGDEDPMSPSSAIHSLCAFLAESAESPVKRCTPTGADIDSVIDVGAIFQQAHRDLAIGRLPAFLLPPKGRYGLRDYEKIFCPDFRSGKDIFDMRGIDRKRGCIVIVRPDQYVAHVLPLGAHAELAAFFSGFMLPRN